MIATWKQHEGQAVDGIALLGLLGSGESSAVFLAERAGERCVVKLTPTEDVVAQLPLSRWEQASALSHPHLSRILQWGRGRLDGIPLVYVAMEYAEEELSSVDRPLTPKEAREMLTPVAKALAYLHGKGFAHGRIKPTNILSVHDKLKISGDAPLRKGERHAFSSSRQPYDPPEITTSGVTPAGDVWSLGVSLVQAMTKELPFEGYSLRLPNTLRPASFRDVAAGCLERDPARRWTVADIAQWLERGTVPSPKRVRPRYVFPLAAAAGVVALGAVGWQYAGTSALAFLTTSSQSSVERAIEPAVQPAAQPAAPVESPAPAPPPPPEPPEAVAPPPAVAAEPAPQPELAPPPADPPATQTRAERKRSGEPKPALSPAPAIAGASAAAASDGVSFPDVTQSVIPEVPARSRVTVHGKVPIVVRVRADATGAVTSAKIESGASSKYFAGLSLKAARQWKFVPGADAREWLLRFEFVRDAQHPVSARIILAPN